MNPDNGEVYAMGSNADRSTRRCSPVRSRRRRTTSSSAPAPAIRCSTGRSSRVGPTGSTFKPITATAALESGDWALEPDLRRHRQVLRRLGRRSSAATTPAAPSTARSTWSRRSRSPTTTSSTTSARGRTRRAADASPTAARCSSGRASSGSAATPGSTCPTPRAGTLPDPKWRASATSSRPSATPTGQFGTSTPPVYSSHESRATTARQAPAAGGCGIADGTDRPWSVGDNESLAVGQGDVQVSPLQLAVAYSAIANGGTIVTPAHRARTIENADGTVLQKVDPSRRRATCTSTRSTWTRSVRACARPPRSSGGTSDDVMGNFHQQVYGKTGTAQYQPPGQAEIDYAWYSCFVPATATSKPIVVIVWVEKGGFGDVGRRAGRPADPVAVVLRQARPVRERHLDRRCERDTPITPAEQTVEPRARALPRVRPAAAAGGDGAAALLVSDAAPRGRSASEADKQALYGGVGVLLALVISRIDYSRLREYKLGLYAVMIALDLVVYGFRADRRRAALDPAAGVQLPVLGVRQAAADRGARRIRRRPLPPTQRTAHDGADHAAGADRGAARDPRAGPRHRDSCTSPIGFAILFFAGTSWKHLVGLVALFATALALALAATPALGIHVIQGYQVNRLTAFVNPNHQAKPGEPDPWYQIKQSEIAIGSGQKTGQGSKSTQSNLGLSAGARHGLRVRVGGRDLRIHRGRRSSSACTRCCSGGRYAW